MSNQKLSWDLSGTREYSTGNKNAILFPMLTTRTTKTQYDHGVAWNGITGVTETPGGAEANDNFADDIKYVSIRGAETFSQTIEAFMAPDEWAACDGQTTAGTGMFGQQNRKAFGFVFRSTLGNDTQKNDYGFEIHISYNLTASPSERSYQTINENPELITYSWECTSDPVTDTKLAVAMAKPVSNIIVKCTTANGVLKVDDTPASPTYGQVIFDESTADGKNVKRLWEVLSGTDDSGSGGSAVSGTYPTLPDPGVVHEILTDVLASTKTVADYAEVTGS